MRKSLFIVFFIMVSFILIPSRIYTLDEAGDELKLYLGEVRRLAVSSPSRIAIANPNIVDVASVSKEEMVLTPKAVGSTTLVFWDNFGEQSFKVKVFAEDLTEAKRRIDNLLSNLNLPKVHSQLEEDEGKILLLGTVKTAQDREKIALVLGPLKDKTVDLVEVKEEESIVEIDVQVLELNKDATNTLGLSWPGQVNIAEIGSVALSSPTKFSNLFTMKTFERATVSGSTYTADPFALKLDILVAEGKARILSRPRLACQSGKEAELLVGGEKPIFTTSAQATVGTSTNVDYKEYGIKLKIKPIVTDEKRIKLALNVEVSEVGTADTIGTYTTSGVATTTTAKAYPLTKRNASTELFIDDGQTMAIGGLVKQKMEEDIRKTPFLGDIPLLGWAFRKRTTKIGGGTGERGESELFITLTPRIISPGPKGEPKVKKETKEEAMIIPESLSGYAEIIQKRILEKLSYPEAAEEAGFQGTVKLSLRLSFRGELLEAKVKETSGYQVLDDNALRVAQGISAYPPFPPSIEQKEIWLDIPIAYQLD